MIKQKSISFSFAKNIIVWQKAHGRHNLPWQLTKDPYAIWVSEIMLQQTQVSTVLNYYAKFMQRFPTIESLASANLEEVLTVWSGLGYYARARNLHRAGQEIMTRWNGIFPRSLKDIWQLPGIGRSTAGAIHVFCFEGRSPILDGNVKRILTRYFCLTLNPENIWELANKLLPAQEVSHYIQGLMDLGSAVCRRSKPLCNQCPLQNDCQAYQTDRIKEFPLSPPKKALPVKNCVMFLCLIQGKVLLEKRQNQGIWGGLWSLPEKSPSSDVSTEMHTNNGDYPNGSDDLQETYVTLPVIKHSFTHFKLEITPLLIKQRDFFKTKDNQRWFHLSDAINLALPSPIKKLLQRIQTQKIF